MEIKLLNFNRVKSITLLFLLFVTVLNLNAQCPSVSDVSLKIDIAPPGQATPSFCRSADDINHVETHEFMYIWVEATPGPWLTETTNINVYDNNVLKHSFINYDFSNPQYFQYAVETSGSHDIKIVLSFSETPCSVTKQQNIQIYSPSCPRVFSNISSTIICLSQTDHSDITISVHDAYLPAVVLSCTWDIYKYNMIDQTYEYLQTVNTTGNSYAFYPPQPGTYIADVTAQVQLPNGSICSAKVNKGSFSSNGEIIDTENCWTFLGHFIYTDPYFEIEGNVVAGQTVSIIFKGYNRYMDNPGILSYEFSYNNTVLWSGYPTLNQVIATIPITFSGMHTFKMKGKYKNDCNDEYQLAIDNTNTPSPPCESCNTFRPQPGEKYWISAWVKENQAAQVKTYQNTRLEISFSGGTFPVISLSPSGDIIEGWQRIVGSFVIPPTPSLPTTATELKIKLVNANPSIEAYFDDIRVHPFQASMKSYVYNPETLLLTAELDDNNYATFYEYDKEGQLIRIKKETSRGIMTIQESRSSQPKKSWP